MSQDDFDRISRNAADYQAQLARQRNKPTSPCSNPACARPRT
jgi:hypothetical protein